MTVDEDGESQREETSDVSEHLATPKAKPLRGNMKILRTGQTWVPKKAEVIVLTKLRAVPCNRCQMKG